MTTGHHHERDGGQDNHVDGLHLWTDYPECPLPLETETIRRIAELEPAYQRGPALDLLKDYRELLFSFVDRCVGLSTEELEVMAVKALELHRLNIFDDAPIMRYAEHVRPRVLATDLAWRKTQKRLWEGEGEATP